MVKKPPTRFKGSLLAIAITSIAASPAMAYESPVHIFNMGDVMRGFDGSTFGTDGAIQRGQTFCGIYPLNPCPVDGPQPLVDKDGTVLYPIDSEFGFYVVDFLGAQTKTMDRIYEEGFAGDIERNGEVVGLRVSNASTDKYKTPSNWGTWCQGLGGTSVKCSSEHYTVMEHVKSCHEVIPYFYADPITGDQSILEFPDGSASYDCINARLDDEMFIVDNGMVTTERLVDVTPCTDVGVPAGCQMFPNDNTTLLEDIAVSSDYSITLKDDGKPLYRWGSLIKRPNDVRMYARIPLPAEWKVPGADVPVTSAKLVLKHVVTNNPNDQVRPEDLENEAAIGRTPAYKITYEAGIKQWVSTKACYEGDGDLLEFDVDPTSLEVGTVYMNNSFKVGGASAHEPLPFSEDLTHALTNAWYTTLDREPFEWSYRVPGTAANVFEYVSVPLPDPSLGELISGPRWRLKPNKFGQDLPGLEIPIVNCAPPPYQRDMIKYEVGAPVVTVLNLLDWDEEEGPSALASSAGWVDVTQNPYVEITDVVNGFPIAISGGPMTEDFDLYVYIKGDKKPTSIYSAQLFINQEPSGADLEPYIDPEAGGGGQ